MHGGPNNSGIVSLSTGPLARPFSCLLAPLTRLFVPDCSLRLRPPLRSLVRSLAHSLVRGKVNYQMVILSGFFFHFDHSAPMVSLDSCLAGLRPPSQFSSWTFGRYPSTFFLARDLLLMRNYLRILHGRVNQPSILDPLFNRILSVNGLHADLSLFSLPIRKSRKQAKHCGLDNEWNSKTYSKACNCKACWCF